MSAELPREQEILEQEDRLTEATQRVDVATLDRLYADDIIFTGVTGVVCDKRAVMDEARRGAAERASAAAAPGTPAVVLYEKDDIAVVRHGDTAVSSFRFGVTIRIDDKEILRCYRSTNVWMKRSGDWQVIAAHTVALG